MGKSVSLVLSSGGARGLAHIGVIDELEARGYSIVSLAGSSMGSLIAGVYAIGKLKQYREWVVGLSRMDILSLIDFTLSSYGFIKGEKVFAEMRTRGFISRGNIENLSIPLTIVATDLTSNSEVIYRTGSLYNAIRASISIPNVFTPVETGSSVLVDGGVLNPLPINHLKRVKGSITLAVDINALIPFKGKAKNNESRKEEPEEGFIEMMKHKIDDLLGGNSKSNKEKEEKLGYFDIFTRTIQLMQSRLTQNTIEKYPPDVLIQLSKEMCGIFEFYRAEELIDLGRRECKKVLDEQGL